MYKYLLFIFSIIFIVNNSIAINFKINNDNHIGFNNGTSSSTSTKEISFTFQSYHLDHFNSYNNEYKSLINHLESNNYKILIHNSTYQNVNQYGNNIVIIGSSKLLENSNIIKHHINNRTPLVLVNVNDNDKKNFCSLLDNVCIDGHSNILAYIPKVSKDGKTEYHTAFHWLNDTTVNETGYGEDQSNFFNSFKSVSNLMINKLSNRNNNYENDESDPQASLIPPHNYTIPFKYFEQIIAKTFTTNVDSKISNKVSKQQFSFSINNQVYLYKDLPNNCIYSLFYQSGYMFPDAKLGIDLPKEAIGSFTTHFSISNKPTINYASPNYRLFSVQSSSPQTVDQTHTVTTKVSTEMSIGVSFDITPDGPSGGASFHETWSSEHSVSNDITDYGVNEMTDPYSMETSWVYHQQYPFDVYTSGVNNFLQWYKQCYNSDGSITQPPALSTSTLQTATSWNWKSNLNLIDPSTNQLNVQVAHTVDLSYSLIQTPDFIKQDKHHRLYYSNPRFTFNLNYNFNNFN